MGLSLLSRMAKGFLWYLSFSHYTVSMETTEMRRELHSLCSHIQRATLVFCSPKGQGEIDAMGRYHRETGCAQCVSQFRLL